MFNFNRTREYMKMQVKRDQLLEDASQFGWVWLDQYNGWYRVDDSVLWIAYQTRSGQWIEKIQCYPTFEQAIWILEEFLEAVSW